MGQVALSCILILDSRQKPTNMIKRVVGEFFLAGLLGNPSCEVLPWRSM